MSTKLVCVAVCAVAVSLAQPGQLAPVQPSHQLLQDSNLRPALPNSLQGVGIDQRLDAQLPLETMVTDEFGRQVPLGSFFKTGKPILLAPVYYRCPMLCTQILNGVVSSLKAVPLVPGRDFDVVAISFDPEDTADLAAAKKATYLQRAGRGANANGWHFLTGNEQNVKAVMDTIGFHYKYDPATDQYAHASGIMVLTPEGRVSKYFYGVEYSPRDVRLGLVEASRNKIGSAVDQILLFCYHYDPATGKYGAVAMNILRLAGGAFALLGGLYLAIAFRRERHVSERRQEVV